MACVFGVLAKIIQLALQFDDRLLEIELMFHVAGILGSRGGQATANSGYKNQRAGLASGPRE